MPKAETTSKDARERRQHTRIFAFSMAASAAIHACALIAFARIPPRDVPQVEPLQVTLDRTEPPQVLQTTAEAPPARPAAPARTESPRKQKTPRTADVPRSTQVEPSPPVAVLTAPSTSEPAFTVAAPEPRGEAPAASSRAEPGAAKTEAPAADKSAAVAMPNVGAAYSHNPKPTYPRMAQRRGEEGIVILRVFVTRAGLPENISVHKTSGHRSLDEAAVEAVRTWRFKPARQGSQAVESWVDIPIVFKLEAAS